MRYFGKGACTGNGRFVYAGRLAVDSCHGRGPMAHAGVGARGCLPTAAMRILFSAVTRRKKHKAAPKRWEWLLLLVAGCVVLGGYWVTDGTDSDGAPSGSPAASDTVASTGLSEKALAWRMGCTCFVRWYGCAGRNFGNVTPAGYAQDPDTHVTASGDVFSVYGWVSCVPDGGVRSTTTFSDKVRRIPGGWQCSGVPERGRWRSGAPWVPGSPGAELR